MHVARFTAISVILSLGLAACGEPAVEHSIDRDSTRDETSEAPTGAAMLERTPAPEGAQVFIVTPADGDTVSNPIAIEFGIEGMDVAKAGDDQPNSGHHHLLIDAELPATDRPIPADANHLHFGDGSTSTEITLEPGTHSLRLLLGDYRHIPHDPPIASDPITITVE